MKKIFSKKLSVEISIHALFWIIHFFVRLYYARVFETGNWDRAAAEVFYLPLRMIVTYFTIYLLIYNYLFKRKILQFVSGLITSLVAAIFLRRLLTFYVLYPLGLIENTYNESFFYPLSLAHYTLYIYPVVGIASAFVLIKKWYDEQSLRQELAKEKLEAELKYLKEQIHPHFLFNTINNIYSMSLEKSDKTPESLLKLSELLDFMLYKSREEKILIKEEIKLINDYIELEKLRYGNRLKITFNKNINENIEISPLLLLPLVENSFKHGAGELIKDSWIKIELSVTKSKMKFYIANNIPEKINEKSEEEKQIGLYNIQRRLEILYTNNFTFGSNKIDDKFEVNLEINL